MKLGIFFLGRKRPGFDPEWGKEITSKVKKYLEKTDYEIFYPSMQIVDDLSLRKAIDQAKAENVDVLISLQPTISDGNHCLTLSNVWQKPVVLWATPTRQTGEIIASNSLVGTHIAASTLSHMNHPYEIVYGMPQDNNFEKKFNAAVRIAYTISKLKGSKLGLIGYQCPGYINVQADAIDLKRILGIQLYHTGLQELLDTMNNIPEQDVENDVKTVQKLKFPLNNVTVEDLSIASRYYIAMKKIISSESLDALAVRCWSELPSLTGQWPYLAFSRFLSEGIAVGCEGDVDGAISCLIGNLLGFGPGYLSDWLEHDTQTITTWHTGNPSFNFLEEVGSEFGPKIGRHFNNNKPAVVEGRMKIGMEITIFRLWRTGGSYSMAAFEAETIEPKRHLMGTNGLSKVKDLNPEDLFDDLCHAGMPHHIAIFPGHHAKTLNKLARRMNIKWIGYC